MSSAPVAGSTVKRGDSHVPALVLVVVASLIAWSVASAEPRAELRVQVVTTTSMTLTTATRQHACCLPDGSCEELGEGPCGRRGGDWEPPGSDPFCVPGICGPGTTIVPSAGFCDIVFGVDTDVLFGALQILVDYSGAPGSFTGAGPAVECEGLVGDFSVANDDEVERVLRLAFVSQEGFEGPTDVARCEFLVPRPPVARVDFSLTTDDASRPDLTPIPDAGAVIRTLGCAPGLTTTTMPPPVCGAPFTSALPPTPTDALFVLQVAARLRECDPCECDVNSSGTITVTDALMILFAASEKPVALQCPAC